MAKRRSVPLWLGLDLGTSAVKGVLVTDEGALVSRGRAALTLDVPQPRAAEQSAGAWWDAAVEAIGACLAGAGVDASHVRGVGLTGQKHALLLLDRAGRPLGAARLWADGRAEAACAELEAAVPHLARRTGAPALPGYLLPKWLQRRAGEPRLASRVAHLLFAKDWIRLGLTGALATDPTEAGASQLWSASRRRWDEGRCAALGIDPAWLPTVVPSNGLSGRVTAAAAARTGLPEGTPVVGGAGDNEVAALACGAVEPGTVAVVLGTSGTVVAPARRRGRAGGLVWGPSVMRRGVMATGTMLSAGRALTWAQGIFLPGSTAPGEALEAAFALPPEPAPPLFVPALAGERSPVPDAGARAAFVGLEAHHGPDHMLRAVVDGVSATLGQIVELLRESRVPVDELRLTSGGAVSAPWRRQILAAARCPGRLVGGREGPARGAALLAARAGCRDPELAAAARAWFAPGPLEHPGAEDVARMTRIASGVDRVRRALGRG